MCNGHPGKSYCRSFKMKVQKLYYIYIHEYYIL